MDDCNCGCNGKGKCGQMKIALVIGVVATIAAVILYFKL